MSSITSLQRYRRMDVVILGAFCAGVAACLAMAWSDSATFDTWRTIAAQGGATLKKSFQSEFLTNPWFYVVFFGTLALERLFPAREQPAISAGMIQDLWWVPFKLTVHATLMPLYVVLLGFVFKRYFGFLTIDALQTWPSLAKILIALLAGDFLFWVSHYVRHKTRVLWHFHAVHHSQRQLNFFTEYRVHPLDDVFSWTIGFIPLFMVVDSFVTITLIVWLRHWHTRFCHSNIRTNMGVLRYILVTPQSHRVHHSLEPRHHDKNFGLTFSIWDYLFGTQYRKYDEYPATGIVDERFPFEQTAGTSGPANLLRQLRYPFQAAVGEPDDAAPVDQPDSAPLPPSVPA